MTIGCLLYVAAIGHALKGCEAMNRKLSIDDEEILKDLYVRFNIPTDQYKRRPDALRLLADTFNGLTERSDDPDDLLHLMITRRKKGRWPTLGSGHKKLHAIPSDMFSDGEWSLIDSIYVDIGVGSDHYAYDVELRKEFTQRFSTSTGRLVPDRVLCAAIEQRRKDGLLPRLTNKPPEAFGDMDAVAL